MRPSPLRSTLEAAGAVLSERSGHEVATTFELPPALTGVAFDTATGILRASWASLPPIPRALPEVFVLDSARRGQAFTATVAWLANSA